MNHLEIILSKIHRKLHRYKFRFNIIYFVALILLFTLCSIFIAYYNHSIASETNYKKSLPRILCYIPLQSGKLRVAKIIVETWGSRCDGLVFYGNFEGDHEECDKMIAEGKGSRKRLTTMAFVSITNSTEEYHKLWGKTKAMLNHVHENYGQEFEWFLKADDDTFVILENLKQFITEKVIMDEKKLQSIWFGFKMKHKKMEKVYMSGGAGYVMNSKALSQFVKFLQAHRTKDYMQFDPLTMKRPEGCKTKEDEGIEDLELGRCFHTLGIKDISSSDEKGRQRFLPLHLISLMSKDIFPSHWIWSQAWEPVKLGKNCCSQNLISIHELSPSQIEMFYFLLYELKIALKQ